MLPPPIDVNANTEVSAPFTPPDADMVYWLQKERGSSSVLVASSTAMVDLPTFADMVAYNRDKVNALVARVPGAVLDELMKVRREVDEFVNLTDSKSPQMQAITFYSIFHTYTCVIYMLLSEDQGAQLEDRAAQKAAQLFAKLKEALAEARGFVCSVLALPDAALPYIPPRAFADFVGFMQRHRAEEAAVLKATPRTLRRFFAAAFDMPELRLLRDTMLDSFDVAALKQTGLTVKGWWEVHCLCPLPFGSSPAYPCACMPLAPLPPPSSPPSPLPPPLAQPHFLRCVPCFSS